MTAGVQQNCLNHQDREAVAKCPTCSRPFCRECITEHDYRMICANCLSDLKEDKEQAPSKLRLPLMPVVHLVIGIGLLWTFFYQVGEVLVNIPVTFHEGRVWSENLFEP